jgi:hypothetical protein
MSMGDAQCREQQQTADQVELKPRLPRRPYAPPVLKHLGSVRELTLASKSKVLAPASFSATK